MKLRTVLISVVVSAALVGGAGYGAYYVAQSRKSPIEVVPVANVSQGYWGMDDQQIIYGSVTSQVAQTVQLNEDYGIDKIYVKAGDEVKEGTPLFSYNMTLQELELEMQQLQLQTNELTMTRLEKELEKLKATPTSASLERDIFTRTAAAEENVEEPADPIEAEDQGEPQEAEDSGKKKEKKEPKASEEPREAEDSGEVQEPEDSGEAEALDIPDGSDAAGGTDEPDVLDEVLPYEPEDSESSADFDGQADAGEPSGGQNEIEIDNVKEVEGSGDGLSLSAIGDSVLSFEALVLELQATFLTCGDDLKAADIGEAIEQAVSYYRRNLADEKITEKEREDGSVKKIRSFVLKDSVKAALNKEDREILQKRSKTLDEYQVRYVEMLIAEAGALDESLLPEAVAQIEEAYELLDTKQRSSVENIKQLKELRALAESLQDQSGETDGTEDSAETGQPQDGETQTDEGQTEGGEAQSDPENGEEETQTSDAENAGDSEPAGDDVDVRRNTVTFDVSEGAAVSVNGQDATNSIAMAENGKIVFSVSLEKGYGITEVLVDGSIPARKNEESDEPDDYVIEGIQTNETIVSVRTQQEPDAGNPDDAGADEADGTGADNAENAENPENAGGDTEAADGGTGDITMTIEEAEAPDGGIKTGEPVGEGTTGNGETAGESQSDAGTGETQNSETSGEDQSDAGTGETQSSETSGEDQSGAGTGETQSSETSGEDQSGAGTGETQNSETNGEDQSGAGSGETQSSETNGEDQSGAGTGETQSSETNGEDQSDAADGETESSETEAETQESETEEDAGSGTADKREFTVTINPEGRTLTYEVGRLVPLQADLSDVTLVFMGWSVAPTDEADDGNGSRTDTSDAGADGQGASGAEGREPEDAANSGDSAHTVELNAEDVSSGYASFIMPEFDVTATARYENAPKEIESYVATFLSNAAMLLAEDAEQTYRDQEKDFLTELESAIVFYQQWLSVPETEVIDEAEGTDPEMEKYQLKSNVSSYLTENDKEFQVTQLQENYRDLCLLYAKSLFKAIDPTAIDKDLLEKATDTYDRLGESWRGLLEEQWKEEQANLAEQNGQPWEKDEEGAVIAPEDFLGIGDTLGAYTVMQLFQEFQSLPEDTPEEDRYDMLLDIWSRYSELSDAQKLLVSSDPYFAEVFEQYGLWSEEPMTEFPDYFGDDYGDFGDYGDEPMYTAAELAEMIRDKEQEIKACSLDIRQSELDLKQKQRIVDGKIVRSTMDGTVVSIGDENGESDEDYFVKVTNETGLFARGTMNELALEKINVGDTISGTLTTNGTQFTAVIKEVSDYPESGGGNYWQENTNASYYPFYALIEDTEGLEEGEAEIYLTAEAPGGDENAIYLENYFIRSESDGRSYVYKKGDDGKLAKQYVKTGKSMYGYAMEIVDGLTREDCIAFPYGKDVKEGAKTKDVDRLSDTYM